MSLFITIWYEDVYTYISGAVGTYSTEMLAIEAGRNYCAQHVDCMWSVMEFELDQDDYKTIG